MHPPAVVAGIVLKSGRNTSAHGVFLRSPTQRQRHSSQVRQNTESLVHFAKLDLNYSSSRGQKKFHASTEQRKRDINESIEFTFAH